MGLLCFFFYRIQVTLKFTEKRTRFENGKFISVASYRTNYQPSGWRTNKILPGRCIAGLPVSATVTLAVIPWPFTAEALGSILAQAVLCLRWRRGEQGYVFLEVLRLALALFIFTSNPYSFVYCRWLILSLNKHLLTKVNNWVFSNCWEFEWQEVERTGAIRVMDGGNWTC
jgi:hypothetical protein